MSIELQLDIAWAIGFGMGLEVAVVLFFLNKWRKG